MNRTLTRWLVSAALVLGAACAQSNGDINRVQPNVMKKSDLLDGVWYYRNVVIDTPATAMFTFPGETGTLEKIVFDVTEHNLVGYRSHPWIPGSETRVDQTSTPSGTTMTFCHNTTPMGGRECKGGHKYYGAPIVRYPIETHFDIQRGYNPATGEQSNVISENASDRPWHEREYIRVDWTTQELGATPEFASGTNPSGAARYNSWVQPNEPGTDPYDWPTLEYTKDKNGKSWLTYMDFTGRYYVNPEQYYWEGYGNIPYCWLTPRADCASSEIKVRTSLSKVDPNKTNDYEPLVYDNGLMAKFGYFRTERLNYDRRFGNTESGRIYLAERFGVWKESFEKDGDGKPILSKPLDMRARVPKPIVYYATPATRIGGAESYHQYLAAARILEKNWDHAFRRAVAAAQNKPLADVPQMLYVCENPVPEVDTLSGQPVTQAYLDACGQPGFTAKFGDLRKSFMYTVGEAVPNGLLGYGPHSSDPETGEVISSNANTYSAAVETYAQYALDVVDLLSGTTSLTDFITGKYVNDYVASNPAYIGKMKKGLVQAELQGEIQKSGRETLGAFDRPTDFSVALLNKIRQSGGFAELRGDRAHAAAERLKQFPDLESKLVDNPELQADFLSMLPRSIAERAAVDPQVARSVFKKFAVDFKGFHDMEKARIDRASNRSMTLMEFMDRPLVGLAKAEAKWRSDRIAELQRGGKKADEAKSLANEESRWRLRQRVWRATSEHEIGHTFGLRHNFAGSFDAVNYFDNYWDLKKPTLTVQQNGVSKIPRTPADLKAVSDGNAEQLEAGMHDFEYSSIMDYSGKVNGDFMGVGKYDEAAILFAYSGGREPGYVEVFENARREDKVFTGSDPLNSNVTVSGAAFDLPIVNAQRTNSAVPNYTERFHYSMVPLHFGEGTSVDDVIKDGITKLKQRKLMKWSDVKRANDELAEKLKANPALTPADVGNVPLEVPYMFCTDDHVGSVLSCNRFDRGPDYFEMVRTETEDYWNFYFFNHFRRGRAFFSANSAYSGAINTFITTTDVYKHWMHNFYQSQNAALQAPNQERLTRYPIDPLLQDIWTMATFEGINNLMQVMQVPPAGLFMNYEVSQSTHATQWVQIDDGDEFDDIKPAGITALKEYYKQYGPQGFVLVPRGKARRMYSRYDYKSGSNFWERMVEAGHYYDEMGAMIVASVYSDLNVPGSDPWADWKRYSVPYHLMFGQEMDEVFSALWTEDEPKVRPQMSATQKPDGTFENPVINWQVKVKSDKYFKDFVYPKEVVETDPAKLPAPTNIQLTWTARIYALYLGMIFFSENFDLDYAKRNFVYRAGAGEQVEIAPGYEPFEAQDLTSGARYIAIQEQGATQDTPAVRMVRIAKSYEDQVRQAQTPDQRERAKRNLRDAISDLDLMRSMYAAFGKVF